MTGILIGVSISAVIVAVVVLLFVNSGPAAPPKVDLPSVPKTDRQPDPNTVDAVVAFEVVRARLVKNGVKPEDLKDLDNVIAPQLFNGTNR